MIAKKPSSLAPYISDNTLDVHYDGHHMTYLKNLKNLTSENNLDDIVKNSEPDTNLHNNAAQVWNHNLFWKSMQLNSKNPELLRRLNEKIDFEDKFYETAMNLFGSGWAWFVYRDDGKLLFLSTQNAHIPDFKRYKIIFNFDLWEHAYYLDYQNKKRNFIQAFFDHLLNWNLIKSKMDEFSFV